MTVAEIVLFKARSGVNREQMLEAARSIDPVLEDMPGFVSREILHTHDERWIDLVRWNSLEQAQDAASKVMALPKCLAFFELIDKESMQFMHAVPAA